MASLYSVGPVTMTIGVDPAKPGSERTVVRIVNDYNVIVTVPVSGVIHQPALDKQGKPVA